jgi:glyoxylase-like metal-dependent hydrolase (beta-lactamase superfamily II)
VKAFVFERNGEPAYGHTAGLTAYILEYGGEKLMFWGDFVNIAPQVDNPDISLRFDSDAAAVTLNVAKQANRYGAISSRECERPN